MGVLARIDTSLARIATGVSDLLTVEQDNNRLLKEILAAMTPGPAVSIEFNVVTETGEILEGVSEVIQHLHTTIHVKGIARDADGNITTLDGAAKVTSDNPAVTIQNVSADGLEFDMVTAGLAGTGPVSVEGDADKSPDAVKTISGKLDVTVPAGDAVTVDLQVGEETPTAAPAPSGGQA
jgi:hypothetical protein